MYTCTHARARRAPPSLHRHTHTCHTHTNDGTPQTKTKTHTTTMARQHTHTHTHNTNAYQPGRRALGDLRGEEVRGDGRVAREDGRAEDAHLLAHVAVCVLGGGGGRCYTWHCVCWGAWGGGVDWNGWEMGLAWFQGRGEAAHRTYTSIEKEHHFTYLCTHHTPPMERIFFLQVFPSQNKPRPRSEP